ncbi:3'(2'),5'-bisphosphate nucleotidase CysQ [Nitratireductor sp. CAU 1489]|uniref:3'(2'),5'-bisphosphate nucleotidase CysQ n=1 Tax=Nitratireductor arenosus TaxID=2682096 RepID=A0A844QNN5_9HYPH|nr:3'(2'),5'-bisphosphate nucleotidase CysQ [Nitratireductor arenosus]MVA99560.1 3'(2'),5'-bisphosphate nucleotidase CysQ [Nitratireductor arenosus]
MRETEPRSRAYDADLALIREAAAEAGRIALGYFGKDPEVWLKGGRSPVSEADIKVDRFLRKTLTAARPDYGWLSEETRDSPERLTARRTFVVDPIDGTRGFLEGRDTWCVSIAVIEDGKPLAGVLECPAMSETFWATEAHGAFLGESGIAVRQPGEAALVGGPKALVDAVAQPLSAGIKRAGHVPSLAYRLALLACGRLDATFVSPNSHDWDLAAADLILSEAGGLILNEFGQAPIYGRPDVRHGTLVAGSGDLLWALAKTINTQHA